MSIWNRILPSLAEPDSSYEFRRRHPPESWQPPATSADAAAIDAETNRTEPPAYLGAIGIFALTGLAALLTAPFRRSTYQKQRLVPPTRHPTTW